MQKNYSLNQLLVLLTTAGFLFLLLDSVLEHWAILLQDPVAFTPVAAAVIGFTIGLVTLLHWKEHWIRRFHMFLFVSILVGVGGIYFHVEPFEETDEELLTAEEREHEMKEKEKPLLAPLSFAGLAAVGLLGTARKWEAEIV